MRPFSLGVAAIVCSTVCSQLSAEQTVAWKTAGIAEDAILVSAEHGASLFADVCAKTLPTFELANARLKQMPFKQDSKSRTFFHDELDLSFNTEVIQDSGSPKCSMVFASIEPAETLTVKLGAFLVRQFVEDIPKESFQYDSTTHQVQIDLPNGSVFYFHAAELEYEHPLYQAAIVTVKE
ncbi:MAG: hypothetical protein ACR2O2_16865 [Ruegeria sp.]